MNIEQLIERFSKSKNEPNWLTELRLKNYKEFISFKEKRISDSPIERRYTQVDESFIEESFESPTGAIFKEENDYFVIDFTKEEELEIKTTSLKHTKMITIYDALKEFPEEIKNSLDKPKDEWSAISNAIWSTGIFVKVPVFRSCERVMKFKVIYPKSPIVKRDIFIIGSNSHMQFVESTNSQEGFRGLEETYINIGKNSSLKHLTMINGKNSQIISIKNSVIEENSQDEWYYALKNLKNGIMVTNATLNGDNSKLLHRGALIGKDNEHYDIATNIYHLANNTKSEADIRAALNDSSRAVMRGKINVSKNSIDSNAYFSGNSLLLNKNAKSNALPFLEIEGNGSQARHSASITNLDYDQLFYVQTRGIDENESKNLIVEGFLDPVVRQILIYEGIRYLVYGE